MKKKKLFQCFSTEVVKTSRWVSAKQYKAFWSAINIIFVETFII